MDAPLGFHNPTLRHQLTRKLMARQRPTLAPGDVDVRTLFCDLIVSPHEGQLAPGAQALSIETLTDDQIALMQSQDLVTWIRRVEDSDRCLGGAYREADAHLHIGGALREADAHLHIFEALADAFSNPSAGQSVIGQLESLWREPDIGGLRGLLLFDWNSGDMNDDSLFESDVISALCQGASALGIEHLFLGDPDNRHAFSRCDLDAIPLVLERLPTLKTLHLRSGRCMGGIPDGLKHPALRHLILDIRAFETPPGEWFAEAFFPRLEGLEMSIEGLSLDALCDLFARGATTGLRALTLRRHRQGDDVIRALIALAPLESLVSLDVQGLRLSCEGVAHLTGHRLPSLQALRVSDEMLTPSARRALIKAPFGVQFL